MSCSRRWPGIIINGEATAKRFETTKLNACGSLFTVLRRRMTAVQRWRVDHHNRNSCFGQAFSWFWRVCGEQRGNELIRMHVA